MISTEELDRRFGVPGVIRIEPGQNGLPRLSLTGELSTAELYLHGAHLTGFQPRGEEPVLFMSQKSHFEDGKPIRGGVPVIFPWFGPRTGHPEAPSHGFARLSSWLLESCDVFPDGSARVSLVLSSGEASGRHWNGGFGLRISFHLSRSLEILLDVRAGTEGPGALVFEEALHTYLRVADVRQVSVEGLARTSYQDKVDSFREKTQPSDPLRITGETDRVYLRTTRACLVRDPLLKRELRIEKTGSRSTVVWNPWIEKARAMPDFGDDEWPGMICVETANVGAEAVRLEPGRSHRLSARIAVDR